MTFDPILIHADISFNFLLTFSYLALKIYAYIYVYEYNILYNLGFNFKNNLTTIIPINI